MGEGSNPALVRAEEAAAERGEIPAKLDTNPALLVVIGATGAASAVVSGTAAVSGVAAVSAAAATTILSGGDVGALYASTSSSFSSSSTTGAGPK